MYVNVIGLPKIYDDSDFGMGAWGPKTVVTVPPKILMVPYGFI